LTDFSIFNDDEIEKYDCFYLLIKLCWCY